LAAEILTFWSSWSGRDSGLFDLVVQRVFVGAPGAREVWAGGDVVGESGVEFGERGVEDAGVGLREEDGGPAALLVGSVSRER
jgi:hypothetical protein